MQKTFYGILLLFTIHTQLHSRQLESSIGGIFDLDTREILTLRTISNLLTTDSVLNQFPMLLESPARKNLFAALAQLLNIQATMYHIIQTKKWKRVEFLHRNPPRSSSFVPIDTEKKRYHDQVNKIQNDCNQFSKELSCRLKNLYKAFNIPYSLSLSADD